MLRFEKGLSSRVRARPLGGALEQGLLGALVMIHVQMRGVRADCAGRSGSDVAGLVLPSLRRRLGHGPRSSTSAQLSLGLERPIELPEELVDTIEQLVRHSLRYRRAQGLLRASDEGVSVAETDIRTTTRQRAMMIC